MQKELKEFFEKNKKARVAFVAMGVAFASEEEAAAFCAGTSVTPSKIGRDGLDFRETEVEELADALCKELEKNKKLEEQLEKKQAEINALINQLGGHDENKKDKEKGSKSAGKTAPPAEPSVLEDPKEGRPADNTGTGQVTEN